MIGRDELRVARAERPNGTLLSTEVEVDRVAGGDGVDELLELAGRRPARPGAPPGPERQPGVQPGAHPPQRPRPAGAGAGARRPPSVRAPVPPRVEQRTRLASRS